MSDTASRPEKWEPTGIMLVAIVLILAMGNFLAVLDLTMANVIVPDIAGAMASSPSAGTWVITGYGVAEAIMVPLTGWLAERFGPVKVFVTGVFGFAAFSLACGLATTLPMLILFRVLLGICGGPLIPISQTLLLKLVPERHATAALAAWSVTTIMAPIFGPALGGLIADNWSWPWAFYVKVPLALAIAFGAWRILTPHELPATKSRVDFVGLALLVVWVGALQIMLGNGQDMDWFNSGIIVTLLIVTIVGFLAFVIWELTEPNPIVNLNIFGNRAFAVSMLVIAIAFGGVFGSIVLVPLWQQNGMGYTATWAGFNSSFGGLTCVLAAPIASVLMKKIDHRAIASIGLLFCAAACLLRITYTDQITFLQMVWPHLLLGFGMVTMMIPLMDMSTASLADKDIASGAGQFNFVRTLSSAISTAIVVSIWINAINVKKAALAGELHNAGAAITALQASGFSVDQARSLLDLQVQGQAVMLGTNQTFFYVAITMLIAAAAVWLAPKPPRHTNGNGKPPVAH